MSQDWRIQTGADDYIRQQNKQAAVENRRPVIRRSSDLVGPGIGSEAVVITDYNDVLATFNGYYSSVPGALYAPNEDDSFVGFVVMDATLGGVQTFTSLVSGNEYQRVFLRSPSDEDSITFGLWTTAETVPASAFSVPGPLNPGLTDLETGESTRCNLPDLKFIGQEDTYARSTDALNILRPGVYNGYIWFRTLEDSTVGIVQVEFPNGAEQTFDTLFDISGGHGVMLPLSFYTTVKTGFVRVSALQDAVSTQQAQLSRLHLTRIGDAS